MIRNLLTPIDVLGQLLVERQEAESLPDYRTRLTDGAAHLAQRSVTEDWTDERAAELAARVGAPVRLKSGAEDEALLERVGERLLTYDTLEGRGPVRWPGAVASGPAPNYDWALPDKGGVATAGSLRPRLEDGTLTLQPGYVFAAGQLFYVPSRPETVEFHLPPGATETVIIPWQIQASHAHAIEVVDEERIRLQASDHHHVLRWTGDEFAQESGPETHPMTPIRSAGWGFMETRPYRASVALGSDGPPAFTAEDYLGHQPSAVPMQALSRVWVETEADATGHSHAHWVDPYDYWSGDFTLVGETHTHQVTDFTVEVVDEHTHTISTPTVPASRTLFPRLYKHEDAQLAPAGGPFDCRLRMKKGWTVAEADFSAILRITFDDGAPFPVTAEPRSGLVGMGPRGETSQVVITKTRGEVSGFPVEVHVRAEDVYSGGVEGQELLATVSGAATEVRGLTGPDGAARIRVPTSSTDTVLTVTHPPSGASDTVALDLIDGSGLDDGWGYDWGEDYGS